MVQRALLLDDDMRKYEEMSELVKVNRISSFVVFSMSVEFRNPITVPHGERRLQRIKVSWIH